MWRAVGRFRHGRHQQLRSSPSSLQEVRHSGVEAYSGHPSQSVTIRLEDCAFIEYPTWRWGGWLAAQLRETFTPAAVAAGLEATRPLSDAPPTPFPPAVSPALAGRRSTGLAASAFTSRPPGHGLGAVEASCSGLSNGWRAALAEQHSQTSVSWRTRSFISAKLVTRVSDCNPQSRPPSRPA